jgi:hypothetical protein
LAADGLAAPLILRTYCRAAPCTSSAVAGGSKLCRVRMFRHMPPWCQPPEAHFGAKAHFLGP